MITVKFKSTFHSVKIDFLGGFGKLALYYSRYLDIEKKVRLIIPFILLPATPPKKAGDGCIILLLSIYEKSQNIQEEPLFLEDTQKFWTKILTATLKKLQINLASIEDNLFLFRGKPLIFINSLKNCF